MTPPAVRFVGAFETVKACRDGGLDDVTLHTNVQHYRHALALNGESEEIKPETDLLNLDAVAPTRIILQAWFVGTHEDLGCANSKDGLSLYPLQWIFSGPQTCGVVLEYKRVMVQTIETSFAQDIFETPMVDPIELVMPSLSGRQEASNQLPEKSLTLENGIRIRLCDLCGVHDNFKVKLNSTYWGVAHKISWKVKSRCMFEADTLKGYCLTTKFTKIY